MENDLIWRGDAFTRFQKQYIDTQEGTDHVAIRINIGVTKCIHAMQDIPAVDAVEVRHGRWEGNYPQAMFRLKRCSVCETLAPEGWYCFFCGARMDGRREEGHNAAD